MSEIKASLSEMGTNENIPLWQIVNKNSPSRFDDANTVVKPALAPLDVLTVGPVIIDPFAIFFRQIEWWIGEDCVDALICDVRKNVETVSLVKDTF
jgi:hypothetical protein